MSASQPKPQPQPKPINCHMSLKAFEQARAYAQKLNELNIKNNRGGLVFPEGTTLGKHFKAALQAMHQKSKFAENDGSIVFTVEQVIRALARSKQAVLYAESGVYGKPDKDWNLEEIELLSDMNYSVDAKAYADGRRYVKPKKYKHAFNTTLLFVSGLLLLKTSISGHSPDRDAVLDEKKTQIDQEKFNRAYEKRLLPLFLAANEKGKALNKKVLLTIPGIGCGCFAGSFQGEPASKALDEALKFLLREHGTKLSSIQGVIFESYSSCFQGELIGKIEYVSRSKDKESRAKESKDKKEENFRLAPPELQGHGFEDCYHCVVVAADFASYFGNEGLRTHKGDRSYGANFGSDEPAIVLRTDCPRALTGVKGFFSEEDGAYIPKLEEPKSWQDIIFEQGIAFQMKGGIFVYDESGKRFSLKDNGLLEAETVLEEKEEKEEEEEEEENRLLEKPPSHVLNACFLILGLAGVGYLALDIFYLKFFVGFLSLHVSPLAVWTILGLGLVLCTGLALFNLYRCLSGDSSSEVLPLGVGSSTGSQKSSSFSPPKSQQVSSLGKKSGDTSPSPSSSSSSSSIGPGAR